MAQAFRVPQSDKPEGTAGLEPVWGQPEVDGDALGAAISS